MFTPTNQADKLTCEDKLLAPETQVIGSIIYEEVGTGELVTNFYTSTINSVVTGREEYPQQPL